MTGHTNPHQGEDYGSQVCRRADAVDAAPTAGVALLAATVVLLVIAVTLSVLQKNWESQAGIAVATQVPSDAVAATIRAAEVAQGLGVSTALLGIATWGWGFCRRESNLVLHLIVLTLLTLFVLMQVIMV